MAGPTDADSRGALDEDEPAPSADPSDAVAAGPADALSAPTDPPESAGDGGEEEAESRSMLADVASSIADAAGPVISAARPIMQGVEDLASGARRRFGERAGARIRRVGRMGRQPLANLWDVHPEARRASIRELGLETVPVELIAGTAVEGAPQRGGDFLPLRDRRSDDWRARWQRILRAVENLANLPPVELTKFGDRYWVVDGHNRVAAALYTGQDAVDAVVNELRLPGMTRHGPPTAIASVLEGSQDLRQAGAGRLTRTSVRPDRLPAPPDGPPHDHTPRPAAPDAEAGPPEPGREE